MKASKLGQDVGGSSGPSLWRTTAPRPFLRSRGRERDAGRLGGIRISSGMEGAGEGRNLENGANLL